MGVKRESNQSTKSLIRVAGEANDSSTYALASELHAKSLVNFEVSNCKARPTSYPTANLTHLWHILVEDLGAVDLGVRNANVSLDSMRDVLGLIAEIERTMQSSFGSTPEYQSWIASRDLSRQRVPVLPALDK